MAGVPSPMTAKHEATTATRRLRNLIGLLLFGSNPAGSNHVVAPSSPPPAHCGSRSGACFGVLGRGSRSGARLGVLAYAGLAETRVGGTRFRTHAIISHGVDGNRAALEAGAALKVVAERAEGSVPGIADALHLGRWVESAVVSGIGAGRHAAESDGDAYSTDCRKKPSHGTLLL